MEEGKSFHFVQIIGKKGGLETALSIY